ncbi:MAG: hypothetical protein JST32_16975 [Bacteroidetes bacterium]|nr:hypothetical protein [Bacteroidota bacterium]
MQKIELQNELASIRSIMERSSKFISLSGLSGILSGIYALIGEGVLYFVAPGTFNTSDTTMRSGGIQEINNSSIEIIALLASLVLFASILTALLLSKKKAMRNNQPMLGAASRLLIFHMMVPLITGGILVVILIHFAEYALIAPMTLIFYGLSLVSAGNFTFGEIKYLGLLQIALGLIAACLPAHGLLFWGLGFGALNIIYGSLMYFKYDK